MVQCNHQQTISELLMFTLHVVHHCMMSWGVGERGGAIIINKQSISPTLGWVEWGARLLALESRPRAERWRMGSFARVLVTIASSRCSILWLSLGECNTIQRQKKEAIFPV